VKAKRVKGLEPGMALDDAAERIVRVRLRELCDLAERAQKPSRVRDLHDTRIAAKRLRYVLEITAPCFGPYAATATKKVKELQDLLGDLHDCDVMLPRVEKLHSERADAAVLAGLEHLVFRLKMRRAALFDDWRVMWKGLERAGFRARLEDAIAERERDVKAPA